MADKIINVNLDIKDKAKAVEFIENGTSLINKYLTLGTNQDVSGHKTFASVNLNSVTIGNGIVTGALTGTFTGTFDGHEGSYYLNYNNLSNKPTIPTVPGYGTTTAKIGTASAGTATTVSRSDHVHAIDLATGDSNGQVKIAGTNVSVKGLGTAAYTASTDYAAATHSHTKAQITDFPTSMPASDVYSWAKASSKPSYKTYEISEPSCLNNATITTRSLFTMTRGNRLAFLPADQIIIEQTTDGGNTWSSYGASDVVKRTLFKGDNTGLISIPLKSNGTQNAQSTDCAVRITITGMKYDVPSGIAEVDKYNYWNSTYVKATERYCQLDTMYFWVCSAANRIYCKVERATGGSSNSWDTVFDTVTHGYGIGLSGWSGMDFITFNSGTFGAYTAQFGNYWNYRITLRTCTTNTEHLFDDAYLNSATTSQQSIEGINAYGNYAWTQPNSMMKLDHMYSWDINQNVTFPAGVSATSFIENGTSLANTYLGKTAQAADSVKLNGQSASYYLNYNNLTNKPTIPDVSGKVDKVTSTDNAIVRFDGTSGNVQNSGITIDDNNTLNLSVTNNNSNVLMFRDLTRYGSGMYHSTPGNEAMVFANENSSTSWIFANTTPTSKTSWQSLAPSLQIKNKRVTINKLIAHNTDADYNLDVNGTANATTLYENGVELSNKYYLRSDTAVLSDLTNIFNAIRS